MNFFTEEDLKFLSQKGITQTRVLSQIRTFREGIPPVQLKRAAIIGDGILKFSEEEQRRLQEYYRERQRDLDVVKFIPAS